MGLVFFWAEVSSSETAFETFSSTSLAFISIGVILKGLTKGLSQGSSLNIYIAPSTSSSNNVPLFHASAALVSSLTRMAS
jgi:hypothetical protein